MGLFFTTTIFVITFYNHIMTIMTSFGVWNLGTEYGSVSQRFYLKHCAYLSGAAFYILDIYQVDILHFKLLGNWISNS